MRGGACLRAPPASLRATSPNSKKSCAPPPPLANPEYGHVIYPQFYEHKPQCSDNFILFSICVATQRKGSYGGKIKIEFCSRGCFARQFLMELLRILSFKTCLMKN